jgi:glutathione synthase/RimK-type ligase-like ATP-grasp enzyme
LLIKEISFLSEKIVRTVKLFIKKITFSFFMNQFIFDVLIVYSGRSVESAGSLSVDILAPFSHNIYNIAYSYFLETCRKNKLKAAFTASSDIIGPGQCSCYWLFENDQWKKIAKPAYARIIFDKFSPSCEMAINSREVLFSSPAVKPFNSPVLLKLFFDKYKTYQKLSDYAIPTVAVKEGNKKSLVMAIEELKKLAAKQSRSPDFSEAIIMKDRFGAGGKHVYKLDQDNKIAAAIKIMKGDDRVDYVLQPFINFDQGFLFQGLPVSSDIRLIYLNGKVVQTYIRTAKEGDFRCNESQGGHLKYLNEKEIPDKVVNQANKIAKVLKEENSLFTLDFLIGNSGRVYFLEGNTGPGLDWDLSSEENEIEAKKLIQLVVQELSRRSLAFLESD